MKKGVACTTYAGSHMYNVHCNMGEIMMKKGVTCTIHTALEVRSHEERDHPYNTHCSVGEIT